ncbi:glycosyltransferase family 4 protein [Nocardioides aestuarii]|uniref:Glycosyltransferase family 4 protein n=1 Tax=Nocardioides aestuarii TaxID=252231 RepID=A0ABW4TLC8_9ACTN
MVQRRVLAVCGVKLIAVTPAVQENEWRRFRVRTRAINNYCSPRFAATSRETLPVDRTRPSAVNTPVVVSVGNCGPAKNHEALLEALRIAADRDTSWRYIHIGAEDRATARELALVATLPAGTVEYVGVQDPLPALQRADLFVMPSIYEGLGIAALEAISAGVPTLLADSPGLRTFKSAEGVWWTATEPAAIADQLVRIAQTPPTELVRRAQRARTWALSAFSMRRSIDAWLIEYGSTQGVGEHR